MSDEIKSIDVSVPSAPASSSSSSALADLRPTNWTKTPEELRKSKEDGDAAAAAEKAKNRAALFEKLKLWISIVGVVCSVIVVVWIVKYSSRAETFQKEQSKVNMAVSEYIAADTEIAKQVRTNTEVLAETGKTVSDYGKRLEILEAEGSRIKDLEGALTKVNKLAVMNRNRLYLLMMKDDPAIEAAFVEEDLDGKVIQDYTNAVLLAISKAQEEKAEKEAKKEKADAPKKSEPVKKEIAKADTEVSITVPEDGALLTPPEIPVKTVKEVKKKDYLLVFKPWKWNWFRSEKQEANKK